MNNYPFNCILLIDDDPIATYINKHMLTKLNVAKTIKTALNGREGLEHIHEFCEIEDRCCPELIFVDVNMTVMDGFDFMEQLNNMEFCNKEAIKIAALTSSDNVKDIERMTELGVNDFITKPLSEAKVMAFIKK